MVINFSWGHSHPELDQDPVSQEEGDLLSASNFLPSLDHPGHSFI